MAELAKNPLKLFYCYAHEDKILRDTLDKHLNLLKRQNLLETWYDREISPGIEWEHEIDRHLGTSDIVLLLISADFMTSEYCYSKEMECALQMHNERKARVVPIILRPVDWEDAPFSKLQVLPTDAKPIIRWESADDAYLDVAKGLRKIVKELQAPKTTEEALQKSEVLDLEKALWSLPVRVVSFNNYKPALPEEIDKYYKGARLSWEIIVAEADVQRDQQKELFATYNKPINKTRVVCLSGEPGAGKSTLAWRLAYEVSQASQQLLIHIPNSKTSDVWFQLSKILSHYQVPIVILVDDIFRSENVEEALSSFDLNRNVTIIATTRSNEIPNDLRLPFLQIVRVQPPSKSEKGRAKQKLHKKTLSEAQWKNLTAANSWLVMMIELTSGETLENIVRNGINDLKNNPHGQAVYRSYKYLCYAGMHQLSIPETLLKALDVEFYKLEEDPAGHGLIVYNGMNASYSTLHPVFAELAFKTYRTEPKYILIDLINAVQVEDRSQRVFLCSLLFYSVKISQQKALVKELLLQKAEKVTSILAMCTLGELGEYWRGLYSQLGDSEKISLVENLMLKKIPEAPKDWIVYLKFLNVKNSNSQWITAIDAARSWLRDHPEDQKARLAFLTLVNKQGKEEQCQAVIEDTTQWLKMRQDDIYVRTAYVGLVDNWGKEEHWSEVIEGTTQWLKAHQDDVNVRTAYIGLVNRRGKEEHWNEVIEDTAQWLYAHEDDFNVRAAYLDLIDRHAKEPHWNRAIEETIQWLKIHEEDIHVRLTCLGLVDKPKKQAYCQVVIEDTTQWLKTHEEAVHVRTVYLALIDKWGKEEHGDIAIEDTAQWLKVHEDDFNVRTAYLRLVNKWGREERCLTAIEDTAQWLKVHEEATSVRTAYLELVSRWGTPEQRKVAIDATTRWIEAHANNSNLLNVYFSLVGNKVHEEDSYVYAAYLGLVGRKGEEKQWNIAIEDTRQWLKDHGDDIHVRAAYLRLVDKRGKEKQWNIAIEDTRQWLKDHGDDIHVRPIYLKSVDKRGKEKQWNMVIEDTRQWLKDHDDDFHIRAPYLGLVDRRGKEKQWSMVIEETMQWLKSHEDDFHVRAPYLGLVDRRGEEEQCRTVIEDITQWLKDHDDDFHIRAPYLGLVDRRGKEKHWHRAIEDTAQWLKTHDEDFNVRATYLGLVDRRGKEEHCQLVIEDTTQWLKSHGDDSQVRLPYLGLVCRRGDKEQLLAAYHLTEDWLHAHSQTNSAFLVSNYGKILLELQLYNKAEKQFRHALNLAGSYVSARIGLAWSCYYQGRKEEAYGELKLSQQLAESRKQYPIGAIFINLGRYWMLENMTERAIEYFQAAVSKDPYYEGYLELGRAFLALKNYTPALQAFKEAKDLLPNNTRPEAHQDIDKYIAATSQAITHYQ